MILGTTYVIGDEKAWGLFEIHEQSPGSKGFHRYQIIQVNRDGKIAEFRRDMGSAKGFKGVNQIRIPSLWEHTVDELMDIANHLRGQSQIDVRDFLGLDKYKPA